MPVADGVEGVEHPGASLTRTAYSSKCGSASTAGSKRETCSVIVFMP